MQEAARHFDFSVIIPIYNMEEYLVDAIESIVNQTIGFIDHIQLVLVNDGSEDGSDAICKQYVDQYPDNVVYIAKQNEGVSVARNIGLEHASGKYINCLDADDIWSNDAFECAATFFKANPSIRIVTTRHSFFGKKSGDHVLSYKYGADQVIHIGSTCDHPHLSLSNAFVDASLFASHPFDDKLKVSEDFLVFNEMLFHTGKYGVLSRPRYWYRKREDSSSAIDSSTKNFSWYAETPEHCYQHLFEISREKFGIVIPYIQYCVMYDLQWRIKDRLRHPLNDKQLADYKERIVDLLHSIDDGIIVSQKNISREVKLYVLTLKHGISMVEGQKKLHIIGNQIFWVPAPESEPVFFCNVSEENLVHFNFIHETPSNFFLEGRLYSLFPKDKVQLIAYCDDKSIKASLAFRESDAIDSFFDENFYQPLSFTISIPKVTTSFKLVVDEHCLAPSLRGGKFFPLSFKAKSYAQLGEKTLTYPKRGVLNITQRNNTWKLKREILYEASLWLNEKKTRDLLKFRRYALRHKAFDTMRKNEIWLISDRATMAGDNGEALFTYLQENPIPHVKPYFVIRDDSVDYARLRKIGKVVAFGSDRHKKLSLIASKIISSAGEDNVFNAFGSQSALFRDLIHFKFVFLQHGVIKDDLSDWLNRFNKNISLFITSAPRERDSIISNPKYQYNDSQVACTGLPRHDKLLQRKIPVEKKVIIAPTWRNNLALPLDQETGLRKSNPLFRDSEYYCFFNRLLNDPRIETCAKENGYAVDFLLHPAFKQEISCFESGFCRIVTDFSYTEEFATSLIMLTDFSSVAFDFALLKKPILYTQFDVDTFFDEHSYDQGYYDYEKDGFGPVCYTYEETVSRLINLMKSPNMEQKYLDRVDTFFYTPSTSRCKEVVDAILSLDKPEQQK